MLSWRNFHKVEQYSLIILQIETQISVYPETSFYTPPVTASPRIGTRALCCLFGALIECSSVVRALLCMVSFKQVFLIHEYPRSTLCSPEIPALNKHLKGPLKSIQ